MNLSHNGANDPHGDADGAVRPLSTNDRLNVLAGHLNAVNAAVVELVADRILGLAKARATQPVVSAAFATGHLSLTQAAIATLTPKPNRTRWWLPGNHPPVQIGFRGIFTPNPRRTSSPVTTRTPAPLPEQQYRTERIDDPSRSPIRSAPDTIRCPPRPHRTNPLNLLLPAPPTEPTPAPEHPYTHPLGEELDHSNVWVNPSKAS